MVPAQPDEGTNQGIPNATLTNVFFCSVERVWRPLWLLPCLSCSLGVCCGGIDSMTFTFSIMMSQSGIKAFAWRGGWSVLLQLAGGWDVFVWNVRECQRRRQGAPAYNDHTQVEVATYQLESRVYRSTSLTSASAPTGFSFSVFGTTTVPLTTFCSLLIWFSPRLALFHAALFALYFRILLLKLFLSSCLFCLSAPLFLLLSPFSSCLVLIPRPNLLFQRFSYLSFCIKILLPWWFIAMTTLYL